MRHDEPIAPHAVAAENGEYHDPHLADAQALVLHSKAYAHARHWLVHAPDERNPHGLLHDLINSDDAAIAALLGQTVAAGTPGKRLQATQLGIGITFAGLQRLDLPKPVQAVLRARAPAYAAGAAVRAAQALADHGRDSAEFWDPAFGHQELHIVLSLQARSIAALEPAEKAVTELLKKHRLSARPLPACSWLAQAPGAPQGHWVHFGYRDALAKLHVRGWPYRPDAPGRAQHAAGEFLLGHAQDSGANPWALSTLPEYVRGFFHNGAFGVMRQIHQDEPAFRRLLDASAEALARFLDQHGQPGLLPPALRHERLRGFIQAKLMGRWPNGQPISAQARPEAEPPDDPLSDAFDHQHDPDGQGCPFGAHIRRMNPRAGATSVAHSQRQRVLLRRGMPYGPAYVPGEAEGVARGLVGLFFGASLEDQFEHIVGQWGAGIALGSPDTGSARDPFVTAQPAGAELAIPLPQGVLRLPVREPLLRTQGTAYLFYPSLPALRQLTRQGEWRQDRDDAP